MQNYLLHLRTLGLGPEASMSEVKSAFRKKAKHLHPDVNPSASAKDEFSRLRYSYEYIISYRSAQRNLIDYKKISTNRKEENQLKKKYGTHKNWNFDERKKKIAKAAERAEKLKQDYFNSQEYKSKQIFDQFFNYLALIILFIIMALVIIFPFKMGIKGLFATPVLFAIGFPLWWAYIKKSFKNLSFHGFIYSLSAVSKTYKFWTYTFMIVSVLIFINITVYAVVSSTLVISLFLMFMVGSKFVGSYFLNYTQSKQIYFSLGLIPVLLNLLFLLNYTFSNNPIEKVYAYEFTPYEGERNSLSEGFIFLENNTLEDEFFLRMYVGEKVRYSSHIQLIFETGLFGIPVVKEYEFKGFR